MVASYRFLGVNNPSYNDKKQFECVMLPVCRAPGPHSRTPTLYYSQVISPLLSVNEYGMDKFAVRSQQPGTSSFVRRFNFWLGVLVGVLDFKTATKLFV